jgi:uncharacterized protein (UPF0335 family)
MAPRRKTDDDQADAAPTIGSNISKLKADIAKAADKIIALKEKRRSVNEDIGAIKANMETQGIPRKALMDAIRYKEEDADKRKGYDLGYSIAREALGLPVQTDMFDEGEPVDAEAA